MNNWKDKFLDKVIQGDCLEVMKELPDNCIDLVVTDFPYGNGTNYGLYEDTKKNLNFYIYFVMPEIRRVSRNALITCGVGNIHLFPIPDWILNWTVGESGIGSGPWGFCCWQPILAYGKDPYLKHGLGRRPDTKILNSQSKIVGHPCPKPLDVWKWLVARGSPFENDIILDPFLGSGTTAVAAKQLGRHYIGIEINPDYCRIAEERLAQGMLL